MRTHIHIGAMFLASIKLAGVVYAQAPIDVERLAAKSEYFQALALYDHLPSRTLTSSSMIAAARSAWALSLPERALSEYDRALKEKGVGAEQAARIYFSKGIIEYQEGHQQVAAMFAEKAAVYVDRVTTASSPLRGRIYLLWGQALAQMESFGLAEEKYVRALSEVSASDVGEVHFWLGTLRLKLGKLAEAKKDFVQVPLDHERTPEAVRHLAEIAIDTNDYKSATFWLTKGRKDYPDLFLDSWVDYALLQVAIHDRDKQRARDIRQAAIKKYPPSDPWVTLLNASSEAFEWSLNSVATGVLK